MCIRDSPTGCEGGAKTGLRAGTLGPGVPSESLQGLSPLHLSPRSPHGCARPAGYSDELVNERIVLLSGAPIIAR
eukprot:5452499-Pyramimonas_sp.AAC.2